ncbi:hypothetical protein HRbin39_00957 [bacterium HR39]|nr:hypothetical protein HRbin39_00957 [bacterium HR39]
MSREVHQPRAALGEGAGLVEDHRVHRVRPLQGLDVAHEDAGPRGGAGPRHQRHRRGEPERAGTGDHQHRDGGHQRLLEGAAPKQPAGEGEERDGDHHRHEDGGDAVHQPLDGGLPGPGLLHQPGDARERGVAAHPQRADLHRAGAVHGAGQHPVTGAARHRHALAGDQGLVELALAGHDLAVHRHPLAGSDQDDVAHAHLVDRDLDVPPVAAHPGALGTQRHQPADGLGGAAPGPLLEPLADADHGDDDGGAVEVEVARGRIAERQHEGEAVEVRGGGAERHQHIHAAGARAQRLPRPAVEAPAGDELDRGGEQQLAPRGERARQAEGVGGELGEERQGEQHRSQRDQPLAAQGALVHHPAPLFGEPGTIAGLFHRLQQIARLHRTGQHRHLGGAQRQVDAGVHHPRHREQRLLDPPHAGGAAHALDHQRHALARHAVAGLLHRLDELAGRGAFGELHAGALEGEVHFGAANARGLPEGALHPPHAGGAAHALHRKGELTDFIFALAGRRLRHGPHLRSAMWSRWTFQQLEGQGAEAGSGVRSSRPRATRRRNSSSRSGSRVARSRTAKPAARTASSRSPMRVRLGR